MGEEVNILNSLWSENYVCGRRQSMEMLTPEEKIITDEEKKFWKMIMTIYFEQGVNSLINYFFSNLKFKRFEQAEIILEFFQRMRSQFPLKISSKKIENRLVQEAQIESHQSQSNNYNMRLGKVLFGQAKFIRMVNTRV